MENISATKIVRIAGAIPLFLAAIYFLSELTYMVFPAETGSPFITPIDIPLVRMLLVAGAGAAVIILSRLIIDKLSEIISRTRSRKEYHQN